MLEHPDLSKCDPTTLHWQNRIAEGYQSFEANLALIDLPQGRLTLEENVEALRKVGVYHLLVRCDYAQALIYLKIAAQTLESHSGLEHPDLADIYGQIAGALVHAGKPGEATVYRFRKLDLLIKLRGPQGAAVKALLRDLAEEAAANHYLEMELSLRLRLLRSIAQDKAQFEIAIVLERIGRLHCMLGRAQSGLGFYKAALALYRKSLGDTDVWVLWCMSKLAAAYDAAGNLLMSLTLYARTHELLEGCLFELVSYEPVDVVHDYEDCLVYVLESYGNLLIKNGHTKDGQELVQRAAMYRKARK